MAVPQQHAKRDKRKRDTIDRTEKDYNDRLKEMHDERWYRRDQLCGEARAELERQHNRLMRDPASVPALQIPLALLNLERDALLESIDMHWEYRLNSVQRLYELECQKIEEEFRKGRDMVRQRLLDGIEERRRKIREDKEAQTDIVADTLLEAHTRPRPIRHLKSTKIRPTPPHSKSGTPAPNANASSSSSSSLPGPSSHLASLVSAADDLLAEYLPPNFIPPTAENIISPLPYSLAILPAPTMAGAEKAKGGRTKRGPPTGMPASALDAVSKNGGGAQGAEVARNLPEAGVWRHFGPALAGYTKVSGWTPGKSLDDLKGIIVMSEAERTADLSAIKGWGRRKNRGL